MLWNDPKKVDGSWEPRIAQPQSSDEYARWAIHFPDPGTPETHVVTYHWEPGPTPASPRRLVFENVPKSAVKKAAEVPQLAPADEARRKALEAMDEANLATVYGMAGLGSIPKKHTKAQVIAAILEAEAQAAK
jgi:hypothetical protein